jgi:hypothetical protein
MYVIASFIWPRFCILIRIAAVDKLIYLLDTGWTIKGLEFESL